MNYRIGKNISFPGQSAVPFALASSENNSVAAVSLQGIHVFEIVAGVNNREAFQLERRVIATPTEINAAHDPDVNRAAVNRDIKFHEIHDVFLDRTISPARATDEPVNTAFRCVVWSPLGLLDNGGCVLSAMTADHRIILYRRDRWGWQEMEQLSKRWAEYLKENQWGRIDNSSGFNEKNSEIFRKLKSRSYLLGAICLSWSSLCTSDTSKWAWLVTLQRSGHVVIWKAEAPLNEMKFVTFCDLQMSDPSTLRCYPSSSGQILLFVGTHRGLLKCYEFSANEPDVGISNGCIIANEDSLSVSCIEVASFGENEVVVVSKNQCIVAFIFQWAKNGLIAERSIALPSLRISGLMWLKNGLSVICSTEDYQIFEVDLGIDTSGQFVKPGTSLETRKIRIPANSTMLCRGIASCPPHKTIAFFALESVKVSYDHLRCRQPTALTVYVVDDTPLVINTLRSGKRMDQALIPLESYKALNGNNWETIWEVEVSVMSTEGVYKLQLLRWFSLFKSFSCPDKDVQDELKTIAEKAVCWLQLKHIDRIFRQLLNRQEILNDDQRTTVYLATKFIAAVSTGPLKGQKCFDLDLIEKIKKEYSTENQPPVESCAVCGLSVEFENKQNGQCPNKHGAPRCAASLRLCYRKTRQCRWCGVHYREEPVFEIMEECLLCGGPTKIN